MKKQKMDIDRRNVAASNASRKACLSVRGPAPARPQASDVEDEEDSPELLPVAPVVEPLVVTQGSGPEAARAGVDSQPHTPVWGNRRDRKDGVA